ncbi:hypothetical protein L1F30_13725 [Simiduia sp. 21SJ11W-1]|uniref:hypothetical protein n=1 Tax=Simiduia sp. 21SJ11W-1 TaxID=2909669 RepID=UPI00209E611C|nr:hypothetical protein [Simiduia sp. 21SJ11W-1]UTA47215.1 hypothetical protein L1F30_13725 [Simiduia sp. 21SJ11W-1]
MLKHLYLALLVVASPQLMANPVAELGARYAPSTLQANTNHQALPSGHFFLQGEFGATTATPAAIAGAGLARNEHLAAARQFFSENPEFFAADAEAMQLHKQREDRFGNHHLRFHRVIAGIPVADMEVIVHFNAKGVITGVNGHIVRPSAALLGHMSEPPKTLSKLQALQQVATLHGVALSELRLLNAEQWLANEAPHQRWHLDLNTSGGIGRFSYWLDAETGALIEVQNTLRHPIPMQP